MIVFVNSDERTGKEGGDVSCSFEGVQDLFVSFFVDNMAVNRKPYTSDSDDECQSGNNEEVNCMWSNRFASHDESS